MQVVQQESRAPVQCQAGLETQLQWSGSNAGDYLLKP
jgi:hypothetical protein